MSKKRGNVLFVMIFIALVFITVILMQVYILYMQINTSVYKVREDIFYIVQNSYFSLDKEELKYYDYKINEELMIKKIKDIVKLNYSDFVKINNIKYDYLKNEIKINYTIHFSPIVFKMMIGEIRNINFEDNIKLKNMEVK